MYSNAGCAPIPKFAMSFFDCWASSKQVQKDTRETGSLQTEMISLALMAKLTRAPLARVIFARAFLTWARPASTVLSAIGINWKAAINEAEAGGKSAKGTPRVIASTHLRQLPAGSNKTVDNG